MNTQGEVGVQGNSLDSAKAEPPVAQVEPKGKIKRPRIKWIKVKREAKELVRTEGTVTCKSLCERFKFSMPNGYKLLKYLVGGGFVVANGDGTYSRVNKPAEKKARKTPKQAKSKSGGSNWQQCVEDAVEMAKAGPITRKMVQERFGLDTFPALSVMKAVKKRLATNFGSFGKANQDDPLEIVQHALDTTIGAKGPLGRAISTLLKEVGQRRARDKKVAQSLVDLAKSFSS